MISLEMPPEGCVSDLQLDRRLAGEMEGTAEGWRVAAHLRSCSRCCERERALTAEYEILRLELAAGGPPEPTRLEEAARRIATGVHPMLSASRRLRGTWALSGSVAAALTMVLAGGAILGDAQPPAHTRAKGSGTISLIAKTRDGTVDRILPGDPLSPGDAIRFEVSSREPASLSILGIDMAGAVTPYVTDRQVQEGTGQVLPGSIVLDETLGAERIVALFCKAPLGTRTLVEAGQTALARAGGDPSSALALDAPGCTQASVLIRKESHP